MKKSFYQDLSDAGSRVRPSVRPRLSVLPSAMGPGFYLVRASRSLHHASVVCLPSQQHATTSVCLDEAAKHLQHVHSSAPLGLGVLLHAKFHTQDVNSRDVAFSRAGIVKSDLKIETKLKKKL